MAARNRSKAFTLIELLVVIVIVAVLVAIAYPSYSRFIQRTRRADGRELIMRVAAAQERFYTNRNSYSASITGDLGILDTNSEKGYYSVAAVVGAGGQTYTITATPRLGQVGDQCGNLILNNVGAKDWSGDKPPTNGACW